MKFKKIVSTAAMATLLLSAAGTTVAVKRRIRLNGNIYKAVKSPDGKRFVIGKRIGSYDQEALKKKKEKKRARKKAKQKDRSFNGHHSGAKTFLLLGIAGFAAAKTVAVGVNVNVKAECIADETSAEDMIEELYELKHIKAAYEHQYEIAKRQKIAGRHLGFEYKGKRYRSFTFDENNSEDISDSCKKNLNVLKNTQQSAAQKQADCETSKYTIQQTGTVIDLCIVKKDNPTLIERLKKSLLSLRRWL